MSIQNTKHCTSKHRNQLLTYNPPPVSPLPVCQKCVHNDVIHWYSVQLSIHTWWTSDFFLCFHVYFSGCCTSLICIDVNHNFQCLWELREWGVCNDFRRIKQWSISSGGPCHTGIETIINANILLQAGRDGAFTVLLVSCRPLAAVCSTNLSWIHWTQLMSNTNCGNLHKTFTVHFLSQFCISAQHLLFFTS